MAQCILKLSHLLGFNFKHHETSLSQKRARSLSLLHAFSTTSLGLNLNNSRVRGVPARAVVVEKMDSVGLGEDGGFP